jgi:MFS family permease
MVFSVLYSLVYAPTLPLTNSLAFHHLKDRDRDFGKVRVWGTIGWIAVGIGMAQWLKFRHSDDIFAGMGDSLRLSAILGVALGVFCCWLPKTPPQEGRLKFAPTEVLVEIARNWRRNPLFWLFVVAFPVSCIHQFYFVRTAGLLGTLEVDTGWLESIFGVGGGGLMTIGQMAEIGVLAAMPVVARKLPRKTLLGIGLGAYILRFFVFAYVPHAWAVVPALALHGLCFGCFFFVAFLIVDEETTPDVRASAQGLFNLVIIGFGVIVGNYFAGIVGARAGDDFSVLFGIPMWVATASLAVLMIFYPRRREA